MTTTDLVTKNWGQWEGTALATLNEKYLEQFSFINLKGIINLKPMSVSSNLLHINCNIITTSLSAPGDTKLLDRRVRFHLIPCGRHTIVTQTSTIYIWNDKYFSSCPSAKLSAPNLSWASRRQGNVPKTSEINFLPWQRQIRKTAIFLPLDVIR